MIISIVIATYNAEETIRRCLESVVNTQAEGYELDIIVIDGGSTDGTVEIVGSFAQLLGYWESAPDPIARLSTLLAQILRRFFHSNTMTTLQSLIFCIDALPQSR